MAWTIEFERSAERDLSKLDRDAASRILVFLRTRVSQLENPRTIGEGLKGSKFGELWKYRVGDYRVIASIEDRAVRILVVRIGHRREIYR